MGQVSMLEAVYDGLPTWAKDALVDGLSQQAGVRLGEPVRTTIEGGVKVLTWDDPRLGVEVNAELPYVPGPRTKDRPERPDRFARPADAEPVPEPEQE